MKRNKRIYLSILLVFILLSCKKDFLKTKLTSEIATEIYIVNLSTTEELLNGIYLKLGMNFFKSKFAIYPELISDNIKSPFGISYPHYSWDQIPDDQASQESNMNEYWMQGYNIIRDCNYVIEYADKFQEEDLTKADNIRGQALAIRALVHHYLVNVFAQPFSFTSDGSHPGIPYVTMSNPKAASRQTVAEVYNNIISDYLKAIQSITPSDNKSKITVKAAKALLARAYLFKGDYAKAKDIAVEVIKAAPLMLTPNYPSKLYSPEDTESLFWLSPAEEAFGSTTWQGFYFSLHLFVATRDVVGILNELPNDVRRSWVMDVSGEWDIKKFPQSVVDGISDPTIAYYHTIIRSSELYLSAAEAYARLGIDDSGCFYLNLIRQRADGGAPLVTALGIPLLDSVYKERRKELCFEGIRMFDLLRTGKAVKRIDVNSPAPADLPYPSSKAIAPIPITDVRVYSLSQNPGYN